MLRRDRIGLWGIPALVHEREQQVALCHASNEEAAGVDDWQSLGGQPGKAAEAIGKRFARSDEREVIVQNIPGDDNLGEARLIEIGFDVVKRNDAAELTRLVHDIQVVDPN